MVMLLGGGRSPVDPPIGDQGDDSLMENTDVNGVVHSCGPGGGPLHSCEALAYL